MTASCWHQRWPDAENNVGPTYACTQVQCWPNSGCRRWPDDFANSGPTFLTAAAQCCLAAVAAYNFNSFFYFTVPIEALI